MNTLSGLDYRLKFIVALMLVLISLVIFFGLRIAAANLCGKRAKQLKKNTQKWELFAFIAPIVTLLLIYNIDSSSKLYYAIQRLGTTLQIAIFVGIVWMGFTGYRLLSVYSESNINSTYGESKYDKIFSTADLLNNPSLENLRAEAQNNEIKHIWINFTIGAVAISLIAILHLLSKDKIAIKDKNDKKET